ncbi:MAG: hypothetical protein JWM86_2617 [Thermoleophilia bacterium]|nr:hypothetical protein [Thermoleophilia bacterium]
MDPFEDTQLTVSNLTPVWEGAAMDGGGSFAPAAASGAVERAVGTRVIEVAPAAQGAIERPGPYAAFAEPVTEEEPMPAPLALREPVTDMVDEHGPLVDYAVLGRRDIARELLRSRLASIAEQREHRSAYEIVFILLAGAVAVLLAAPPLVQVLLAARGIQA